ncbi:MAG: DUF1848 domain-containing protein [Leptospirales bacterium]|nr:DUF1848 domain-containing protein [Leptospirales bacterium]
MIISASRRTDVPAFYSEWFFNRLKEGFVLVRNPINFRQISRVSLSPDVVDGIVFWTKNPIPMLGRLNELKEYVCYFQFTITPYEKDIEPNIPTKSGILTTFKRLSDIMGADRVIWRYDPIMINAKYSMEYHIQSFKKITEELHDYTRKVIISFLIEDYRAVKSNSKELALLDFQDKQQIELSAALAQIAHGHGLLIEACAETIDLQQFGIKHARCIDEKLLEKLSGCRLNINKDKTQRPACGCVTSIDIGMYNTCMNGCKYCYANYNQNTVKGNFAKHSPLSPLISGDVGDNDKIKEREVKSCR